MAARVRICVLGDGGVGKTAIVIRFEFNEFEAEYSPTIGDHYGKRSVIDGESCLLFLLDTAGSEEFTSLRDQWIRDCEGFIIVYSITDKHSFEEATRFRNQIIKVKDTESSPLILVGNKCDLEDNRVVLLQEGKELAAQFGCVHKETSAKTGFLIEETIFDLVRLIRASKKDRNDMNNSPPPPPPPKAQKRCSLQ